MVATSYRYLVNVPGGCQGRTIVEDTRIGVHDIFHYAQQHVRIIVSCNRDHFLALAEQALRAQQAFAGLIGLIRRRTRQAECAHLLSLLRCAGESGAERQHQLRLRVSSWGLGIADSPIPNPQLTGS